MTDERIQDRLAEVAPDLLEWFERGIVPPDIDATTGMCHRCGCLVVLTAEGQDAHVEWHASLTIGIHMLAQGVLVRDHWMLAAVGRFIAKRRATTAPMVPPWLARWVPRGRR